MSLKLISPLFIFSEILPPRKFNVTYLAYFTFVLDSTALDQKFKLTI